MEQLQKLEEKIKEVLTKYAFLKAENAGLQAKLNEALTTQMQLEDSLLKENEAVGRLCEDREETKVAIEKLVTSLESFKTNGQ